MTMRIGSSARTSCVMVRFAPLSRFRRRPVSARPACARRALRDIDGPSASDCERPPPRRSQTSSPSTVAYGSHRQAASVPASLILLIFNAEAQGGASIPRPRSGHVAMHNNVNIKTHMPSGSCVHVACIAMRPTGAEATRCPQSSLRSLQRRMQRSPRIYSASSAPRRLGVEELMIREKRIDARPRQGVAC